MTSTYSYSLSADFSGNLNSHQLHQEIHKSSIVPVITEVRIVGDDVDIVFNSALSAGEQTTLNGLVSAHTPLVVSVANFTHVQIQEETIETGGHFFGETIKIVCPTGPYTQQHNFSFPIDVTVLIAKTITSNEHLGDNVSLMVAPDTTIGTLTSSASTGATGLSVSSTVIANTKKGFYVSLTDGVNSESTKRRVIDIDTNNDIIYLNSGIENAYDFTTPTYVKQTVYYAKEFEFGVAGRRDIGSAKIGGTYLPANTPIRAEYTNNSTTMEKTFIVEIEYLY